MLKKAPSGAFFVPADQALLLLHTQNALLTDCKMFDFGLSFRVGRAIMARSAG